MLSICKHVHTGNFHNLDIANESFCRTNFVEPLHSRRYDLHLKTYPKKCPKPSVNPMAACNCRFSWLQGELPQQPDEAFRNRETVKTREIQFRLFAKYKSCRICSINLPISGEIPFKGLECQLLCSIGGGTCRHLIVGLGDQGFTADLKNAYSRLVLSNRPSPLLGQ